MLNPAFAAVAGKAHDTAPGSHRLNRRHTKLDRFLYDPVHLVAGSETLHQRDLQLRLAICRIERFKGYVHCRFQSLNARQPLAAATIEQTDMIACAKAQYANRMMRGFLRKVEARAGSQGNGAVKAGNHGFIIS